MDMAVFWVFLKLKDTAEENKEYSHYKKYHILHNTYIYTHHINVLKYQK